MGGFPWPREEWKGNMADIVSRDEWAKNKLDCFYKWYTFEEITCARYLHRIGWKGKAIFSHKHNVISALNRRTFVG